MTSARRRQLDQLERQLHPRGATITSTGPVNRQAGGAAPCPGGDAEQVDTVACWAALGVL